MLPTSQDHFDPTFYKAFYDDVKNLDPSQAVTHWIRKGRAEGRYGCNEAAVADLLRKPEVPPGFSVERYLSLNPDVAESVSTDAAAIRHYIQYGREEGRYICKDDDVLITHPSSSRRLPGDREREAWRSYVAGHFNGTTAEAGAFRARVQKTGRVWRRHLKMNGEATGGRRNGLPKIIADHPRLAWIDAGFNLTSYLFARPELIIENLSHVEVVFHFLEFGLEHGYYGRPAHFDRSFIIATYGIDLTHCSTPLAALACLRKQLAIDATEPVCLYPDELFVEEGYAASALASRFDHEFYRAVADQGRSANILRERASCIRHFLDRGCAALVPINPDSVFDAAFYRTHYKDELRRSNDLAPAYWEPKDLYCHWLKNGLTAGFEPNLFAWARARFDVEVPDALVVQLSIYALHTPDVSDDAPPDVALEHLLEQAGSGIEHLDLSAPEMLRFLIALADRSAMSGEDQKAERLYWLVLRHHTMNGPTLRHLADLFHRQGREECSQHLRERLLASSEEKDIWTYILLAEGYTQKGQTLASAEILHDASIAFPGNVDLHERRLQAGLLAFDQLWGKITQTAKAYGLERTRRLLSRALKCCTRSASHVLRSEPVRSVAIVGNHDLPQCAFYRIEQKREHLKEAGYEVAVFNSSRDTGSFLSQLDRFQAVIFFRVAAFPNVIEAIERARAAGLLTFYDIDDIVFDETLFPPPLEAYAGQLTVREYNAMACGVPLFAHAMSLCDFGIASTTPIAELMQARVRSGTVFLHRNALGQKHHLAMQTATSQSRRGGVTRIFYGSGTKAHKQDFHEILEPALARVAKTHGKRVEILLIGHFSMLRELARHRELVTVKEPTWDFEDYCDLLSTADINLSVLIPSLLTDAKSEIKWLEAAMLGIPSVVSRTRTHEEVIRHGETGFLCETTDDFERAISRLVTDAALRRKIGEAAKAEALEVYGIKRQAGNLQRMFEEIRPVLAPAKQRLLIVNVFYPPQAIGGATRVVHDNVRDLMAHYGDRYEIDIVCTLEGSRTPYEITRYAMDGVRVWAIGTPDASDIDQRPRDEHMGEVFTQILDKVRPDLVHFHCIQRLTASVVEAARFRCIPYLITAHDGWWISPHQFLIDGKTDKVSLYNFSSSPPPTEQDRRMAALKRPLLSAVHVLGVSEPFADLYRLAGVSSTIAVPNGVSALPTMTRLPSETGRVRLAHIGGMERHKGLHLVRNALFSRPFKNLQLLVVDHAMSEGSVRQATWGATPVTFVAKVPQDQVAKLYSMIDVLLAPSVWPESYGLVTREALLAGAWVVASDRGAVGADVSPGENGFVVSVLDGHEPLASVLKQIDDDPETYRGPSRTPVALRTSLDQAHDLAALYDRILMTVRGGAAIDRHEQS